MSDSSLKVDSLPAAFAHVGTAHNALVDLIKNAEGKGGIAVYASDGKLLIDGSNVSVTAGAEGDPVMAVGTDGKLNRVVKHSTWATATTYPTELRTVNAGRTVRMDANGLSVEGSSLDFLVDPVAGTCSTATANFSITLDPVNGEIILTNLSNSTYIKLKCPTFGGPDIILQGTVRSLEMREIDVCDGGVAKKMLIIGSAPY